MRRRSPPWRVRLNRQLGITGDDMTQRCKCEHWQECDEAYGYKLTTDKGYADIVFRNSSNGNYGGSIELLKRELPEGMIAITDDWQA